MRKKVSIQDIIPLDHRRSIQDISMADVGRDEEEKKTKKKTSVNISRKEEKAPKPVKHISLEEPEGHFDSHSYSKPVHHRPRWGMVGLWFLVIIVLIGGFVFVSSFFHSAKVFIKIKEVNAEVDTSVNMQRKDATSILPFEIMSLSKEVGEPVPTNGEKQVSDKATGRVIIYNKNTTSQKLIAQTRLEAPSGKIYRLTSTVTVAGAKKTVPGSLEVTAVADAPGPDYNSSVVDLTFPGFKGTAKYQSVYAMSKTPFSGGALGTVKVADKEDLAKAEVKVKDLLEKELLSNINQQIPNSFILLPNVYMIKFASTTQETKDNILTLKQKADIVAVLVDTKKLSMYIAKNSITGYSGEDVMINNIKDLSFTYATSTTVLNMNTNSLSLKIKGTPHFVYGYDASQLKDNLMGISRESFASIIATYPGIEKGNSKISPFWRSKFPTDLSKITINEEK